MAGHFDVVVAEALDRLSRDQQKITDPHKRMRYLGVEIITNAEDAISEMHIGLEGTMCAQFLLDLADKTNIYALQTLLSDSLPRSACKDVPIFQL